MKRVFVSLVFLHFFSFLTAQKQDHVKGQVLVQLLNNLKITDLPNILSRHKAELISTRCLSEELNIWQLQLDEFADEKAILNMLRSHPSVSNAQLNHYVELRSILTTLPNDSQFSSQWHLLNTGQSGGTAGADIKATQTWDITTGGMTTNGDTIVVAVIDSGFEPNHPDILPNHWFNWKEIPNNGIDDDLNGFVDDFKGWNTKTLNDSITGGNHAVKVEGMIGAVGNNTRGVTGVNWKVKMMSIKIDTENGTEADVVAAYNYALVMRRLYHKTNGKKGAFVVATNSSFGSNGFAADAPLWCAMYDTLGNAGILNVGSTVNANNNVDVVGDIPSTCPSDYLIIVTSTDRNDVRDSGAGFGVTHVDVAAPGVAVYTTAQNGSYITDEGTSFACPIVTGIAALAYATPCSDFINLSKTSPKTATLFLKDWILRSVDIKVDLMNKIKTGGRVNAFKTLQKVLGNCGSCQQPSALTISTTTSNAQISFKPPTGATFQARYRRKNEVNWVVVSPLVLPLSITDLTECTDYDLELKSNCNGDFSTPYTVPFKTDGCCSPPDQIEISDLTQKQFKIKFSKITAALGYVVCVKEMDANTCVFEKTMNDTSVLISNLSVCKRYQVSIKSNCSAQISPETVIQVQTLGCGPCFDLKYCTARGSSVSEWIDSFSVADFHFKSGKNAGYVKFDTVATVLRSGKKYQFALKPAFAGPIYNESLRVWIDYNGDGDFEDAGEQVWEVTKFNAVVKSDSFTVPFAVSEGVTRMRVAMKYVTASNTPPQYCEVFDGGEVEDYCIRLEKSSSVSPLISDNDVKLYPNPFNNYFILKNENKTNRILRVELLYADGRIFYAKQFDASENEYLVADLPPIGVNIVFVKIETEKGVLVKKMIRF